MMNDIKFRAWDKKNKKFLKPYREQHIGNLINKLSINMDGSLSFHENDGFGGKIIGGESIEKRFEIMQYTGLKDKNGTEIYEGDALGKQGYWGYYVGQKDGAYVAIPLDKFQRINWSWENIKTCADVEFVVIGNIYENPELLLEDN